MATREEPSTTGQATAAPRVLAVDDEPDVREILQRYLTKQGFEVRTARDARETLDIMRDWRPDVLLLDIIMPGMDGIDLCIQIRADPRFATIPVLFLTGRGSVEDRIHGFEAGGDDYLAKPFDLRELTLRVRALLRRQESRPAREGIRVGRLFLDAKAFVLRVDSREVFLTPVEFELMAHFMRHPGEVFSAERLLQEVWGYAAGAGDPALIRAHVHNLRNKIEPDPADPVFIRTASRHGYVLVA
jgi:DNA-binding response OmpR family regulator